MRWRLCFFVVLTAVASPLIAQSGRQTNSGFDAAFRDAYQLFRTTSARKKELSNEAYLSQLAIVAQRFRKVLTLAVPTYQGQVIANDATTVQDLQDRAELGEKLSDTEQAILGASFENRRFQQARYLLAFVELQLGRAHDATILAWFVSRNLPDTEALSLDSAHLALAAALQAYKNESSRTNAVERDLVTRIAEGITARWTNSSRANEACLMVARIMHREQRLDQAAAWYGRVTDTSFPYAEAQISAGQIYWQLFLESLRPTVPSQPPSEIRRQYLKKADDFLTRGIRSEQKRLIQQRADPDAPIEMDRKLVSGLVSLAQLQVYDSREEEAISTLTSAPFSVLDATRPTEPKNDSNATILALPLEVRRILLRAYIGVGQIKEAVEQLEELESLSGLEVSSAIAGTYVEIGRSLEKELRSTVADTNRRKKLQKAFQTFLDAILARQGRVDGAVLLWVGQTYQAFADGSNDLTERRELFARAAEAYQQIADASVTDLSAAQTLDVRLRQVQCLRGQQQWERAMDEIKKMLSKKPRALELQKEAALILDAHALSSGQPDDFRRAVSGTLRSGGRLWGWQEMERLLSKQLQRTPSKESLVRSSSEIRVRLAKARLMLGQQLEGPARQRELAAARLEIEASIAAGRIPTREWFPLLNDLYRQILEELGEPARSLEQLVPSS